MAERSTNRTASTSRRAFPTPDQYQAAVTDAANLGDENLRGLSVERFAGSDYPFPRTGKFGAVYKFTGNGESFATKVFFSDLPHRELRYQLISTHFRKAAPTRTLVSFRYGDKGIRVNRTWYPALVMEWALGETLDGWIDDQLRRAGHLDNAMLCKAWVKAIADLRTRGIAHGDLQHGNILVQADRSFRLIDYDGTFVPEMTGHGLQMTDQGLSAYQHPQREASHTFFNEHIDDFPALTILLNLASIDRELWGKYHGNGDRLLLSKGDFEAPRVSPVLDELAKRPAPVGDLVALVTAAAEGELEDVPHFEDVAADLGFARSRARRPPSVDPSPDTNGVNRPLPTLPPGLLPDTRFIGDGAESDRPTPGNTPAQPDRKPAKASDGPGSRPGPQEPEIAVPVSALAWRQQEILALLAAGKTPDQIADRLSIQSKTVRGHLAAVRSRIGVASDTELLKWARAKRDELPRVSKAKPLKPAPAQPARAVALSPPPPQQPPHPLPRPPHQQQPQPPLQPLPRPQPQPPPSTVPPAGRTVDARDDRSPPRQAPPASPSDVAVGFVVLLVCLFGAVLAGAWLFSWLFG